MVSGGGWKGVGMRRCTSNLDISISANWKPCLRQLCLLLSLGPMLDL